jgi:hypothetical protein
MAPLRRKRMRHLTLIRHSDATRLHGVLGYFRGSYGFLVRFDRLPAVASGNAYWMAAPYLMAASRSPHKTSPAARPRPTTGRESRLGYCPIGARARSRDKEHVSTSG